MRVLFPIFLSNIFHKLSTYTYCFGSVFLSSISIRSSCDRSTRLLWLCVVRSSIFDIISQRAHNAAMELALIKARSLIDGQIQPSRTDKYRHLDRDVNGIVSGSKNCFQGRDNQFPWLRHRCYVDISQDRCRKDN